MQKYPEAGSPMPIPASVPEPTAEEQVRRRVESLLSKFDGCCFEDDQAVIGRIVGELGTLAIDAAGLKAELRRQVVVLQERVLTLEIREQNLIDDVLEREPREPAPVADPRRAFIPQAGG